jgi:RNA polymerase sigma-70 factor (subfamily 1)
VEQANDNLLDRAVHGDREALVELLKGHGPAVRSGLAGWIPKRWQTVLSEDDVMQQMYADAVAKVSQFTSNHESAFTKWLETIARHNLNDAVKGLEAEKRGGNRRRVERVGGDESCADLIEVLSSEGTTPSGHVARGEAKTALERAIGHLPEAYARVVMMYDLEARSVQEVAEALGRSPGAVFMLRARAHERLHEIMGHTSQFFSDAT